MPQAPAMNYMQGYNYYQQRSNPTRNDYREPEDEFDYFSQYYNTLSPEEQIKIRAGEAKASWQEKDYWRSQGFIESWMRQIRDPQSALYKRYKSYLQGMTPSIGTDTLLGLAMSSGMGYGSAQAIAGQKSKEFARERSAGINQGVGQFMTSMQGQMPSLLELYQRGFGQQAGIVTAADQQRLENNLGSQLLNVLGAAAGTAVGAVAGKQSGGQPQKATMAQTRNPYSSGGKDLRYNPYTGKWEEK